MDRLPPETRPTSDTEQSTNPWSRRAWWAVLGVLALGLTALWMVPAAADRETSAESSNSPTSDPLTAILIEARQANAATDVEGERRILERGRGLQGDAEDLAEIERRLAVVEWKYHADFEAARARLLQATEGAEASEAWTALARLEMAREDFTAATSAGTRAVAAAEKDRERRDAELAFAKAVIADMAQRLISGQTVDAQSLSAAVDTLLQRISKEPGELEPSRWLLRGGLLADRGEAALVGWRSYFQLGPGQPPPNAIADAGADLERILPHWPGTAATAEQRIALALALAGSRFFEEAALVARAPSAPSAVTEDSEVALVVDYADTLDRLRRTTEEYYRRHSLGQGEVKPWSREIRTLLRDLVARHHEGDDESLDVAAISSFLESRLGAYVNIGHTAGVDDLHMGHHVIDERRSLEQYGERAEVRFISLDAMVSNGFQSWAWEDGAQHGGWPRGATIYQVRAAYADGPLQIWRKLQSPEERAEHEEEMHRASAGDDERAREDPSAYLPGLSRRIRHQGLLQLVQGLEAKGHTGDDLRLAFLAELARVTQESSIFAHEGRHVIDKRAGITSSERLEYLAKLSEVAFAEIPKLATGGIFTGNIGDGTPHGEANRQIMEGLVGWMEDHRDAIEGLDSDRPLLPQFDLLTDDQIRAAFRSLDPLAKAAAAQS